MKECQWCDKSILEWLRRSDIEFCSDECRAAFHNHKRLIKRKLSAMDKNLSELIAIASERPQFSGIISKGLREVSAGIHDMQQDYYFECRGCGQMTYEDVYASNDENGVECPFCGKHDWSRKTYKNARR